MAEIRRWGADELLADTDAPMTFDLAYALPDELELDETYEWRIDGRSVTFAINGHTLTQTAGAVGTPALVVETTKEFMRRWAAGETNWNTGRKNGQVTIVGPEEAWNRMLVATNYPGRPAGLVDELLAARS